MLIFVDWMFIFVDWMFIFVDWMFNFVCWMFNDWNNGGSSEQTKLYSPSFVLPSPRQNTNSIAAQNKLRDGEESKKIFRFDDNNLPNHVNTRKLKIGSLKFHQIFFWNNQILIDLSSFVASIFYSSISTSMTSLIQLSYLCFFHTNHHCHLGLGV